MHKRIFFAAVFICSSLISSAQQNFLFRNRNAPTETRVKDLLNRLTGDEVVQVYIQYPNLDRMPLKELKSFKRIFVEKENSKTVQFEIPLQELQKWDLQQHQWKIYSGDYSILIGSSSQDLKLKSTVTVKAGIK